MIDRYRKMVLRGYKKLDKRRRLFPGPVPRTLTIKEIRIKTDFLDAGGYDYYNSRKSYEEYSSKLYDLINESIAPTIILDIGANYGFISCVSSLRMPQAKIIAIEPSKKLIPFIEENFELNGVKNYEIHNSLCGETDSNSHNFSINPYSSQDNRVIAPKSNWYSEEVGMVCINSILKETCSDDSVFIKIDTQGFEEMVFEGGKTYLNSHKNWIIKTEFAPDWLRSQNTDPHKLLKDLIEFYEVAELPATIPYFTKNINSLFDLKINPKNIEEFIEHIENLNINNLGWCDLIIRPKNDANILYK